MIFIEAKIDQNYSKCNNNTMYLVFYMLLVHAVAVKK